MSMPIHPGRDAVLRHGWLRANKWLLLRRLSQLGIVGLFLIGPLYGIWWVKGSLSSSLTLDTLPLTDPLLVLQSLFAGHIPEMTALLGACYVVVFYLLVGGRVYCGWVCPVNPFSDLANALRNRLQIADFRTVPRYTRYFLLAVIFLLALLSGSMVWEHLNPVSLINRGIAFLLTSALSGLLVIFLAELLLGRRIWCGHLCPSGAFYSLLNVKPLVRIDAVHREQCNHCMDCYAVCPESQVISPALNAKAGESVHSLIDSINCLNCGRCIDVCAEGVFKFSVAAAFTANINLPDSREMKS